MGDGSTKECHEAVAQELINGPFIVVHFIQGEFEELVQDGMHDLWPQSLGETGGVGQVTEEDRDLLAFAFKGGFEWEDLFGQMRGV